MAIESNAETINDLNPLYPRDRDYLYEGAAHIRLVKQTIKSTFPNITEPVLIDSDTFSIFSDKLTFTGDAMDVGGLMVKNATPGTGDKDLTTKGQVEAMFDNWLQNKIYRVGSYYITEENINPGDSISLGFGTWAKVTGMIMGSGIVNPDGSVPNASRVEFVAGGSGGRVHNTIRSENLPLTTINGSSFSISQYRHSHTMAYNRGDSSGHNSDDNFLQPPGVTGEWTGRTSEDTHGHTISGTASFGRDDVSRQPINTMPPYRVANIWRRLS